MKLITIGLLETIFTSLCFITLYYSGVILGIEHELVRMPDFVEYSISVLYLYFAFKFNFPFLLWNHFTGQAIPAWCYIFPPEAIFFPPYSGLIQNLVISTFVWWIFFVLLFVAKFFSGKTEQEKEE